MKNKALFALARFYKPHDYKSFREITNCLDYESYFALDDKSINFITKAQIVRHIYICHKCQNSFREFQELNNSVNDFSLDIYCSLNNHKSIFHSIISRFFITIRFQKKLLAASLCIILLAVASFFFIKQFEVYHSTDALVVRGLPSHFWRDLYPKPFASLSRHSIYFSFNALSQYKYWQINVFDSDLSLIWESPISEDHLVIPFSTLIEIFKINHTYYWNIRAFSVSNRPNESHLFPFVIID
jgi:hypothetical protein